MYGDGGLCGTYSACAKVFRKMHTTAVAPIRISASAPAAMARRGSSRQPSGRPHTEGEFTADFLICGTGVDMDCGLRPELASIADKIATWADRYDPRPTNAKTALAAIPTSAPTMPSRKGSRAPLLPQGHPLLRHRCLDEFRHERCFD